MKLNDRKSKADFLKRLAAGKATVSEIVNEFDKPSLLWSETDSPGIFKTGSDEVLSYVEVISKYGKKYLLIFIETSISKGDDDSDPVTLVFK